jgi:thioredoxin reductase (NADPH)
MAATYLGRFRRRVMVIDTGESRAKRIPVTRNCPGFSDGISGVALLARMRTQAVQYGTQFVNDTVHDVRLAGGDFVATASYFVRARSVFIATGVVDTLPESPDITGMIEAGTLRLCPICDAYEVINKRVAVVGPVDDAMKKALFLRTFSDHVTVLATDDAATVDPNGCKELTKAGIGVEACVSNSIRAAGNQASVRLADGRTLAFDTIYPAMGCTVRSTLATKLGAGCDELGNLLADSRQRTGIPGLYAIGDIVNEINQLAVAFGHAAIAATDVHNFLAERDEERRVHG